MSDRRSSSVVHLLGPLQASGMERMLVSAAPHWQAAGLDATVIGQGTWHPYASELENAGYRIEIFPRGILAEPRRFVAVVRQSGASVVHIHAEARYLLTAVLSAWAVRSRRRNVRTVHNVFLASGWWGLKRRLQALAGDRFVGEIVAPSTDVARNERRFWRQPRVIYNWVDDSFYKVPEVARARRTAIVVGNCSSIKNHELALEAAREAEWRLIHIGDERTIPAHEAELLDALVAEGHASRLGRADPRDAMAAATVLLMPSIHEGMGVVVAEALVLGMPVILADVPGLRWAAGQPGVSLVSLHKPEWVRALHAVATGGSSLSDTTRARIDFSAARGAREYAALYRLDMQ